MLLIYSEDKWKDTTVDAHQAPMLFTHWADLPQRADGYGLVMGLTGAGRVRRQEVEYGSLSDGRTRLGKFRVGCGFLVS